MAVSWVSPDVSFLHAVFRRQSPDPVAVSHILQLIDQRRLVLMSHVTQELLCGVVEQRQFRRLAHALGSFPVVHARREDFMQAAALQRDAVEHGLRLSSSLALCWALSVRAGAAVATRSQLPHAFERFGLRIWHP